MALHSSDPLTPYLATWARTPDFRVADLEGALYETRTLCRLHAMRRTLFVVPSTDRAVLHDAVGRENARKERNRVERWLGAEMDADHIAAWLEDVETRVLQRLAADGPLSTQELTAADAELGTPITVGSGRWASRAPVSSRLLFVLAMEGKIVRTRPAGTWRSSQYRWASVSEWFPELPPPIKPEAARVELARRYLAAYGPVTMTDVRWWTGWTASQTTAALTAVGALPVTLETGTEGWVLADDLDTVTLTAAVALLPGLDPTPMGWKERDWYLGPHGDRLFDRNGNAGPTVWVRGRVVGGWGQRPDGEVVWRVLEDVGGEDAHAVERQAAALTAWLEGTSVTPRFRTPLERELSI